MARKLTEAQRQKQREECRARSKDFFVKLKKFFIKAFDDAQNFIDNHIEPVLHFVQGLKAAVDSPAGDFVINLIPGKVDDAIVQALRTNLGEVITILQIRLDCSHEATNEDRIRCFIEHLRAQSPEMQSALYHRIASLLTRINKGEHTFTNAEIDAMIQLGYNNLKVNV